VYNFYVYIYLDPRKSGVYKYGSYEFEYEPFYIGKGKNERWKYINNRSDYFKNKINKIKESKLEPIVIKLKENLDEDSSFILEKKLIKLIGRKDLNEGSLLNFTDGGEGGSGYVCSDETKNKHSEIMKGENNPNYGKHPSEKTRKLISEKCKGKKHHKQSEKMRGENSPTSILKEKDVIEIWKYINEGILTQKEIGKLFGVNSRTISCIKNNKTWKHLRTSNNAFYNR